MRARAAEHRIDMDKHFQASPLAHHHNFVVTREDIDDFGHANNVVWVRWVNEAAISHSNAVGLPAERLQAMDVIWVVRKHEIEYLAPAFEGQTLRCTTWPAAVRGATSLRRSVFTYEGRVLARAETIWALLHALNGKPRRVSSEFMAAYGYEPGVGDRV
jgi:acyl-CoA thioester hydrolase